MAGESALDRIACGLGGKIILPMIKQHIMQMLQNRELNTDVRKRFIVQEVNPFVCCAADWKYRHAGLMALSAIGEGCHQQMETILSEIVCVVLRFCADPVRHFEKNTVIIEINLVVLDRNVGIFMISCQTWR